MSYEDMSRVATQGAHSLVHFVAPGFGCPGNSIQTTLGLSWTIFVLFARTTVAIASLATVPKSLLALCWLRHGPSRHHGLEAGEYYSEHVQFFIHCPH